jgi:AcrR family transcriptional regulator
VLAAGRRLVVEKGTGFTTHEVVKEAGVALQTFYRYFGGKDQLLLALFADLIRDHCERLAADVEGVDDPVARLDSHIRATMQPMETPAQISGAQFVTAEHWRLTQLFPDDMAAAIRPFTQLVRSELVAGRAAGVMRPRHPERDARLITKTVVSAYHDCAFRPDDPHVETLADDVSAFCLAAVDARTKRQQHRGRSATAESDHA